MDKHEHHPADEEVAAYVCGEMTPGEAAGFERRMETDEVLRREVEEWREVLTAVEEWTGEEPPDIERVEDLPVPSLGRRKGSLSERLIGTLGVRLRPALATTTVFVLGFLLGAFLFGGGTPVPDKRAADEGVTVTVEESPTPSSPKKGPREREPESPGMDRQPQEGTDAFTAVAKASRFVTQDDGRIVVETTLARSGARVVMVVDGEFQIPPGEERIGGEQ